MANSLPKHYIETLENGLQIVVIPMKNNSGVISTDIFYKVGSRDEKMGKSGIAHMLEHLNFKSTKNLKAGEFDVIVKKLGGMNNASTSFDTTHYYIKSSSKYFDKTISLFAELMENLKLLDSEFQIERDVVAEERRLRTDNNPMGYLYFKLFNTAFTYHSYHWTPIGFMDDIKNWTINDIKKFHKTFYRPDNAIVVVAGDIDKDYVFKTVKSFFGNIKNSKKKIPKVHTIEPKQDGAKRLEIIKDSNELEILALAYHIPNFEHKDQIALTAISEILSSGKSSILESELVEKKRLVNNIYAYNMEEKDPSLFLFLAVCNKGVKAIEVEKELLKIINNLKTTLISENQLTKVKINTKSEFIFAMESSSNIANIFGNAYAKGNINHLLNYEKDLELLTPEILKDVANRYFNSINSTTVILKQNN